MLPCQILRQTLTRHWRDYRTLSTDDECDWKQIISHDIISYII